MIAPARYIVSFTKKTKLTVITIALVIMFTTSSVVIVYSFEKSNEDLVNRFISQYYIITSTDNIVDSRVPLNLVNGTYVSLIYVSINGTETYLAGVKDYAGILGSAYSCKYDEISLGKYFQGKIKGYATVKYNNTVLNLTVRRFMSFKFFPSYWAVGNYSLIATLKNSDYANFVIVSKYIQIPGYITRSMISLTSFYKQTANEIGFDLFLLNIISIVVIYMFINTLLTMEIKQNMRKIGIIRAIGSTKKNISGLYMLRALYVGFVGMLIGFSMGIVMAYFLATVIPLAGYLTYFNIYVPSYVFYMNILLAVVGSFFASIRPVKNALKVPILSAIRSVIR